MTDPITLFVWAILGQAFKEDLKVGLAVLGFFLLIGLLLFRLILSFGVRANENVALLKKIERNQSEILNVLIDIKSQAHSSERDSSHHEP